MGLFWKSASVTAWQSTGIRITLGCSLRLVNCCITTAGCYKLLSLRDFSLSIVFNNFHIPKIGKIYSFLRSTALWKCKTSLFNNSLSILAKEARKKKNQNQCEIPWSNKLKPHIEILDGNCYSFMPCKTNKTTLCSFPPHSSTLF